MHENFISALHADWDQQCLCYQDRHLDKAFSLSLQEHVEITVLTDENLLYEDIFGSKVHC